MESISKLFEKTRLQVEDSNKHLPLSEPQLPRPLVQRFRKNYPESIIFTRFFSDVRHFMLTQGPTEDILSAIPANFKMVMQMLTGTDVDADNGLSYLHLAVLAGDLPLAYESLSLGTAVDCTDKSGFSPLFFGIEVLWRMGSGGPPQFQDEWQKHKARMRDVCLFLIAHHSDPNETHGEDISLLALACIIRAWELVRALLIHGATSKGLTKIFRNDPVGKARFDTLSSELSSAIRPPRICPCGSHRPLKDCHDWKPQLYPTHYICPCGSRKTHTACCEKKPKIIWRQYWNEEKGWLDFSCTVTRSFQALNDLDESHLTRALEVMGMRAELGPGRSALEIFGPDKPNVEILQVLLRKGRIDPAFVAVCMKTTIFPRSGVYSNSLMQLLAYAGIDSPPVVCAMPKPIWTELRKTWNGAVDAYIASGADQRSPEIIQAATKIGFAGGPLRRKCGALGCSKMEIEDSEPFRRCSHCKKVVYCSPSCQKMAWEAHRKGCKDGTVVAQLLPSQEAYLEEMEWIARVRFA